MAIQTYNIALRTPMGAKQGTLSFHAINGSAVDGELCILGKTSPIRGTISEYGECQFIGELISLMRAFPFEARGWLNGESLTLTLQSGKHSFVLDGTLLKEQINP